MDKTVDFRRDVCGHIILWAKGWYHDKPEKRSVNRLYEVIREVTGMPEYYVPGAKQMFQMVTEIADKLNIKHGHVMESALRSCGQLTTYHVHFNHTVPMIELFNAYIENIAVAKISDGEVKLVLLPDLNEAIRAKYDLPKFPYNEINKVSEEL